jgi:hypothetical protein
MRFEVHHLAARNKQKIVLGQNVDQFTFVIEEWQAGNVVLLRQDVRVSQ